jgi:hypothetical protein
MIRQNKIKNHYFNRKLSIGKKTIILEVVNSNKVHYIEQLNIMGGVDIFDLKGNIIILDIEINEK